MMPSDHISFEQQMMKFIWRFRSNEELILDFADCDVIAISPYRQTNQVDLVSTNRFKDVFYRTHFRTWTIKSVYSFCIYLSKCKQ